MSDVMDFDLSPRAHHINHPQSTFTTITKFNIKILLDIPTFSHSRVTTDRHSFSALPRTSKERTVHVCHVCNHHIDFRMVMTLLLTNVNKEYIEQDSPPAPPPCDTGWQRRIPPGTAHRFRRGPVRTRTATTTEDDTHGSIRYLVPVFHLLSNAPAQETLLRSTEQDPPTSTVKCVKQGGTTYRVPSKTPLLQLEHRGLVDAFALEIADPLSQDVQRSDRHIFNILRPAVGELNEPGEFLCGCNYMSWEPKRGGATRCIHVYTSRCSNMRAIKTVIGNHTTTSTLGQTETQIVSKIPPNRHSPRLPHPDDPTPGPHFFRAGTKLTTALRSTGQSNCQFSLRARATNCGIREAVNSSRCPSC